MNHGRALIALGCGSALFLSLFLPSASGPQSAAQGAAITGQSVTLLPDGRWLRLGGEQRGGVLATAEIHDPDSGASVRLTSELLHPRAWHTATVLPDGSVLILGGVGPDGGVVSSVERFDPTDETIELLPITGPMPRAGHTATLLVDGRLLIVGGTTATGALLEHPELWDPETDTGTVEPGPLSTPRTRHSAALLPTGEVLIWGGLNAQGKPLSSGERYTPSIQRFTFEPAVPPSPSASPSDVALTLPADGAVDVSLNTRIAVLVSRPLRPETVNAETVQLAGPEGIREVEVAPAEGGMLVFVTPNAPLHPQTRYVFSLRGAIDADGDELPPRTLSFKTTGNAASLAGGSTPSSGQQDGSAKSEAKPEASQSRDEWEPVIGKWRTDYPPPPWQSLPPLGAPAGVTALAGQALTLVGDPLADVTLAIGARRVRTDATGRFLLSGVPAGPQEVVIDGRTASQPGRRYGVFEVGVTLAAGRTTALPYSIWMPRIDTAHAVTIPSPTTKEVVITTPKIPGLEVRIPGGTVIRDHEGRVATEVSITPIPVDRPPFPLARNIQVPVYYTIQPGGGYVSGPSGVRVIYPNANRQLPGQRYNFWRYEPSEVGWSIYGLATVSDDGRQIVPNPGVALYEFTGAMINTDAVPPDVGSDPARQREACGGDPVDLSTGLFILEKTDVFITDTIPIAVTRTYRHRDRDTRPFGIGTSHPYAIFLWSGNAYQESNLILPDGARIHYNRISPGVGFTDAVFEHTETTTVYFKSRIVWNGGGWDLTLKDGTVYVFGENAPLQAIRDRWGNQLMIAHANGQSGNVTRVTSPNNRWVAFTYDTSNRVTQATDHLGRTVAYTYDELGQLVTVTDPLGGVTRYTYDTDGSGRMITLQDPRGAVFLTNYYDENKVARQTHADGGLYHFAYTVDANSRVMQADVTDPRGNARRVTFNAAGYMMTDTCAVGKLEEQVRTYTRQLGTNLVLTQTDALGRQTAFTYDPMGNVASITRAAGTPLAATTSFSYESTFNQVSRITDPLGHATGFAYDTLGNLSAVTNPLGQPATFAYNSAGQPVSATDPLGNTTRFAYDLGDLVAVTDPLGNITRRFVDTAGRLRVLTDPLGRQTGYEYDALDRVTSVTDALTGVTRFGYDASGNLLRVTDARGNTTTYTYSSMDRVQSRSDPLLHADRYVYDLAGNLITFTSRKSQATTSVYDALNRRAIVKYADNSTSTYAWDKGNRLTQVVDSVAGTITRTYDLLDRPTKETTPQGSVSYTYDVAGRRTSMTVPGQAIVTYAYDAADRLVQVTQGTSSVSLGYDAAGRRTSVALPNGMTMLYVYDAASRMTGITYKRGTTIVGDLTYAYDAAGQRVQMGGSFARTGLPQPLASASYNAANQLIKFGSQTLTYDLNGNLTSDGVHAYAWNARSQLAGTAGPGFSMSFRYDGLGRRWGRVIGSTAVSYLYDGITMVQQTGGTTVNLLSGLGIDEYFTRTDNGGLRALLTDALGSTLALADTAGALQTQYTYGPFGATTSTGPASTNVFQYTGRENDSSGLYYYRARYYHPGLQRFISEDPKEGTVAGNRYSYVESDPVSRVDPLGLFWEFSQSTGILSRVDDSSWAWYPIGRGYSGRGPGLNNPAFEATRNMGPIPTGWWRIGPQGNYLSGGGRSLRDAMWLTPMGSTNPLGRDGFLIHGGNFSTMDSSQGCIVLPVDVRNQMGRSGDRELRVVP
jgi:RHS repeat-associated protein